MAAVPYFNATLSEEDAGKLSWYRFGAPHATCLGILQLEKRLKEKKLSFVLYSRIEGESSVHAEVGFSEPLRAGLVEDLKHELRASVSPQYTRNPVRDDREEARQWRLKMFGPMPGKMGYGK